MRVLAQSPFADRDYTYLGTVARRRDPLVLLRDGELPRDGVVTGVDPVDVIPAEATARVEERHARKHGSARDDPATGAGAKGLAPEQQREVARLKQVDEQVRAHEQAHLAAAGSMARGAPTYTFVRGPDGKQYAVAGEVQIDTSAVSGDPQQTLAKAQRLEAAALAPADPSPQDLKVAADARRMAAEARAQQVQQRLADLEQVTGEIDAATGLKPRDRAARGTSRKGRASAVDPRIRAYTSTGPPVRGQVFTATM